MRACVLVMLPSDAPPGSALTFEMPKSRSLTRTDPSLRFARKRFAGFRSRWTIPAEWTSPSPSHACIAYSMASPIGSDGVDCRSESRSRPSRYSITRYGAPPSSVPTSETRATYSLWMRAAARASRRNRPTASGLADACELRMNFSATRCSSCRCVATTTQPMPPSPSSRLTRYLPASTVPGGNGIEAGDDEPGPEMVMSLRGEDAGPDTCRP